MLLLLFERLIQWCPGRDHALDALSHDEHHSSTQLLRQHEWARLHKAVWRQPKVFGPSEPESGRDEVHNSYIVEARITFKTSATLLRNLFPSQSYDFAARDTVALATLCVRSQQDVPGPDSYETIEVRLEVHDVAYTQSEGSNVRARYVPVVFENSPEAICTKREELGYPSVFADIRAAATDGNYTVSISWKGHEFATLWLRDLSPRSADGTQCALPLPNKDVLVHRRLPKILTDTRGLGTPLDEDIVIHERAIGSGQGNKETNGSLNEPTIARESSDATSKDAGFQFKAIDAKMIPTLHHIVNRLAELPIFGIVEATLRKGVDQQIRSRAYTIGSSSSNV